MRYARKSIENRRFWRNWISLTHISGRRGRPPPAIFFYSEKYDERSHVVNKNLVTSLFRSVSHNPSSDATAW